MAVVDSIPHNSTKGIVKAMLEEVVAADTSLLFGKIARSPEGNVDVEPPSSMDDSSMILIEIGVDVDEGPHPNTTIGDGAWSSVEPVTKMPMFQLICRQVIDPLLITQRNSQ